MPLAHASAFAACRIPKTHHCILPRRRKQLAIRAKGDAVNMPRMALANANDLASISVPEADCLVPGGRGEQFGIRAKRNTPNLSRMPFEEGYLLPRMRIEDPDTTVQRTGGNSPPVRRPGQRSKCRLAVLEDLPEHSVFILGSSCAYRTCGNPKSTLLDAGSGQRLVTTFARV
jgi:hypothetical protein